MKSMDIGNTNNDRAFIIEKLQAICDTLDLSYEYTEKWFKVKLPPVEEIPVIPAHKRRKSFDTSTWGDKGIDETELPIADEPLEEGETPEETK